MQNLTVGKITIFKTLPISKIIHLSLVTNVLTEIIIKHGNSQWKQPKN